jgi:hypothetical protein
MTRNRRRLAIKKNLLAAIVVGGVLLLVVPLVCYPAQRTWPFRIKVVDEQTLAGLPNARVAVEGGGMSTTEFDGSLLFWLDTALMDRNIRFQIEHRGVSTTVGLLSHAVDWS